MPISTAPSEADDMDVDLQVDFDDLKFEDETGSNGSSMMPPPPAPPPGGGSRTKKAKTSDSGKSGKTSDSSGVSPGKQGKSDQRGPAMCLMPKCDRPQKKKCKWCQLHNCHFENLKYAMEHNKKNGRKERKQAWLEEMKDMNKAVAAITQQEENNAGIAKWRNSNKQHLEMTWQEQSGSRLIQDNGIRKKPYEKEEYILRQMSKKGWFDEFSRILLWPA